MATLRQLPLLLLLSGCTGTTGDVLSPMIDASSTTAPDLSPAPPDFASGHPPVVMIFHPPDHDTRMAGVVIPFVGYASEPRDMGLLTGSELVWESSLQGQFATGEMPANVTLNAGVHTITLRATDPLGLAATASITLTVN
jgi:hypothetical protein